jgi:hypothetical protein
LNYAIAGTTSPWSAINAPVRSVTIAWPGGSGSRHRVSFGFTTQRRPFSGDDLYLHPSFTGASIIGQMQGLGLEGFAGMPITGGFEHPGAGMLDEMRGQGAEAIEASRPHAAPEWTGGPVFEDREGPIGRKGTEYERRINKERGERERDTRSHEQEDRQETRQEKEDVVEKRQERQQAEQERVANARDQAYQKEMRRQIAETKHEDIEKKLAADFADQGDDMGGGG